MTQVFIACILRMVAGSWVILNDTDHQPINCQSVITNTDNAELRFGFTAAKIHTLTVTPDETYVLNGINAGASVGMDRAYIQFSQGTTQKTSAQMQIAGSNLWVWGLVSVGRAMNIDRESPFKIIERRHMEAKLLARECELLALKLMKQPYDELETFKEDLKTLHEKLQKLGDTL